MKVPEPLQVLILLGAFMIADSVAVHPGRMLQLDSLFRLGPSSRVQSAIGRLNDLNLHLRSFPLPAVATRHRNADTLLLQDPPVAHTIRDELLSYGGNLPLIELSHARFPISRQVLAVPLRQPHGQGGPGTTLAILIKERGGGLKLVDFAHVAGVHPDDFVFFLSKAKTSGVTTLGRLYSELKFAGTDLL